MGGGEGRGFLPDEKEKTGQGQKKFFGPSEIAAVVGGFRWSRAKRSSVTSFLKG